MSPTRHYVDPPDTAYVRERYKRVAIEASHRDDSSLIQIATKNLSRRVESIIPARPFLDQPLNKVESLGERFGSKLFYSRARKLHL